MMLLLGVLAACLAATYGAVLPAPGSVPPRHVATTEHGSATNVPLLLWHGLGDAYDSDGIKSVGDLYRKLYPDSPVYFVHLGDNAGADRHSSFFGNLTEQVNSVCEDIRNNRDFAHAPAANALGFSQGGVFVRGLVERCDAINVRNLVTFGSPHSGITEFTKCADGDWWCNVWSGTLKSNTWSSFAQSTLIPAQYFRNSEDLDNYLLYSNFLADINNERAEKAEAYKKRIAALDRFVMYKFQDEDVLSPPEGSWFSELNSTSGLLTRLKERDMYREEWLGLKELDEAGGLVFRTTPGKHMQIGEDALEDAFKRYYAPSTSDLVEDLVHDAGDSAIRQHGGQTVLGINGGAAKERVAETHSSLDVEEAPISDFLRRYGDELADTFG